MGKHDDFFSRSLERIELVKDFIRIHLPIYLMDLIDIDKASRVDRTNTDKSLTKRHRDIIYSVPFEHKEHGMLFFAIEHQSTMDNSIPVRFLRYTVDNLEAWNDTGADKWPIFVNLLLYHGRSSPYSGPCDTDQIYQNAALGNRELYLRFHVIDLTQISDKEILIHGLCAPMEVLLKHSRDGVLELPAIAYRDAFQICIETLGNDYLFSMLTYIDLIEDIEIGKKLHNFVEELFENKKDIIMTYGQLLGQEARQEGRDEGIVIGMEKGMEKGREEEKYTIAKNLFSEGMTIPTIKKVTGLSEESLQKIL